jgi:hypothetical protein
MSEIEQAVNGDVTPASGESETEAPITVTEQDNSGNGEPQYSQADLERLIKERVDRQSAVHAKEVAALQATPTAPEPVVESPTAPPVLPADASEQDHIRNNVEFYARQAVEKSLGMDLARAQALLNATETIGKDWSDRTWREGCEKSGLDVDNTDHQNLVAGLLQAQPNLGVREAIAKVGSLVSPAKSTTGATVEPSVQVGGVQRTALVEGGSPTNRAEAHALAKRGIRATHKSSADIIKDRLNRERGQRK